MFAKVVDDVPANKIVRNPYGRIGSPAHRARILEVQERLKAKGWKVFAGGAEKNDCSGIAILIL